MVIVNFYTLTNQQTKSDNLVSYLARTTYYVQSLPVWTSRPCLCEILPPCGDTAVFRFRLWLG